MIPLSTSGCFLCLVFVTFIFTMKHVTAKESDAERIGKIICTPNDKQNKAWFKCIECCQSINCYDLKKKDTECNREARKFFVKQMDLDPTTRTKVCVGQNAYNLVLKEQVIKLKGPIKTLCKKDKGMKQVHEEKVACFNACGEFKFDNPIIKKWCPKYKP